MHIYMTVPISSHNTDGFFVHQKKELEMIFRFEKIIMILLIIGLGLVLPVAFLVFYNAPTIISNTQIAFSRFVLL